MRYTITYSKTAEKQMIRLRKRGPKIARRLVRAIEAMAEDPFAGDVKRMKNVPYHRRRVGDWRIIFAVKKSKLVIEIIELGHRREVYRR